MLIDYTLFILSALWKTGSPIIPIIRIVLKQTACT